MAAAAHLKVQPHPTTTRHRRRCPTQAPLPPPSPPPPPPHFSKFNSALNAGILNPMSPTPQTPPQTPPPGKLTRSSPTLFEMMAKEHDCTQNGIVSDAKPQVDMVPYKEFMMQERVFEILETLGSGSQFNDEETSDVRLTLVSKDGFSVRLNVHRRVLVSHSRVLAGKLSGSEAPPYTVEVVDCEDIEAYIEGLSLMYCEDLRRWLMKEDVHKVLGILKVSAAIGFDAGILSCLEYLEAAPWEEDEEEKVASLLLELQLEGVGVDEVLKRVSLDVGSAAEESGNDSEEVLIKLLLVILEGKDEKARREMKALVSKLLRENANRIDIRKESLYSACDGCLLQLRRHFLKAAASDLQDVGQIARQADNLFWILDILIDRNVAEDFMKTWASESEMANAHSKVAPIHRFEVSGITAKLFVGIGKGQILASKDDRCLLLQTWLVPFYDDFGWMKRASKGLDRHVIEEGLTNTILTLPLAMQQDILLAWFDRFLNSQEECPNIQRGFEIWWRRAFWNRSGHLSEIPHVQIANGASENL